MKKWYQELFENYAETYDHEDFTKGTMGEVDFIEREIQFDKSIKILDIGCGTGRHSIEMAKREYQVTGIDYSESQLKKAREKAAASQVQVEWLLQDARHLNFIDRFDLVIMMCEGAFPLMETDEENFQILANAARALIPGGKFIFTTLNGLFPLCHSVKDFINDNSTSGMTSEDHRFDLMTFRDYSTIQFVDDLGMHKTVHCNERYYAPSEITWQLKSLNFTDIGIYNARQGAFSRADVLTPNDFEMLVVAVLSTALRSQTANGLAGDCH